MPKTVTIELSDAAIAELELVAAQNARSDQSLAVKGPAWTVDRIVGNIVDGFVQARRNDQRADDTAALIEHGDPHDVARMVRAARDRREEKRIAEIAAARTAANKAAEDARANR